MLTLIAVYGLPTVSWINYTVKTSKSASIGLLVITLTVIVLGGTIFSSANATTIGSPVYSLQLFRVGGDVPIDGMEVAWGQEIRAVATVENDPSVSQIEFRWFSEGELKFSTIVPVAGGVAEDIQQVFPGRDVEDFGPGEWKIEADFGNGQVVQKTLFSNFFVLPESPIGALAMVLSSAGAVGGYFYLKSRRTVPKL
jgi:hypothetical protein